MTELEQIFNKHDSILTAAKNAVKEQYKLLRDDFIAYINKVCSNILLTDKRTFFIIGEQYQYVDNYETETYIINFRIVTRSYVMAENLFDIDKLDEFLSVDENISDTFAYYTQVDYSFPNAELDELNNFFDNMYPFDLVKIFGKSFLCYITADTPLTVVNFKHEV